MEHLTPAETIIFLVGMTLITAQYVALIWFLLVELRREIERHADAQERKAQRASAPYAAWHNSLRQTRAEMELLVGIDLNLARLKALQIRLQAAAVGSNVAEVERLLAKMERVQGEVEAAFDMLERPRGGIEASQDRLKALLTERYILLSRLDAARMRSDVGAEAITEAELILIEQQLSEITEGGLP